MDGFNLCRRIKESPDDYILFLRDPTVPLTNNLAERCAGKYIIYKRKARQMMSFRGDHGDEYFCDALSILETLKLKKTKPVSGNPFTICSVLTFVLLPVCRFDTLSSRVTPFWLLLSLWGYWGPQPPISIRSAGFAGARNCFFGGVAQRSRRKNSFLADSPPGSPLGRQANP